MGLADFYNFALRLQHLLQAIGALTCFLKPNSAIPMYATLIWLLPRAVIMERTPQASPDPAA